MMPATLRMEGIRVEDTERRVRVEIESLEVGEGEAVALVGESACGKSTTMNVIINELPPGWRVARGRVLFHLPGAAGPVDLLGLRPRERRRYLGKHLGYLPQDWAAMDPLWPIGKALGDSVRRHRDGGGEAARERIGIRLAEVGLDEPFIRGIDRKRPGECSGGECQRILFVQATIHRPYLLLADEPTTGLDPLRRMRILRLIQGYCSERRSALLVTHDLGAAAAIADRVYVLYQGRVVEHGRAPEVLGQPRHPYTRALVRCLPILDGRREFEPIEGDPPSGPWEVTGCKFQDRCPLRRDCPDRDREPGLRPVAPGREVACHVI
jgi:oligopeptide/dipeptide ABC transporter ATP-binding protein